jgi:beta-glucosidase
MKPFRSLLVSLLLAVVQAADSTVGALYKDPTAAIDDRVADLLGRMTIEEKTSQLIQGDIRDYLNLTDGSLNTTGLAWVMEKRSNSIWTGLYAEMSVINKGTRIAQEYLLQNTTLG